MNRAPKAKPQEETAQPVEPVEVNESSAASTGEEPPPIEAEFAETPTDETPGARDRLEPPENPVESQASESAGNNSFGAEAEASIPDVPAAKNTSAKKRGKNAVLSDEEALKQAQGFILLADVLFVTYSGKMGVPKDVSALQEEEKGILALKLAPFMKKELDPRIDLAVTVLAIYGPRVLLVKERMDIIKKEKANAQA